MPSIAKRKIKPNAAASGIPVWCHHDELVDPNSLADYPKNPNTHSEEQCWRIVGIIKVNGWREPITLSLLSGRITKGHGRKKAAILAGWKRADVLGYLAARRIPLPPGLGRKDQGGLDFNPAALRELQEKYPDDWERWKKDFPFAEIQLTPTADAEQ